MPPLSHVDRLPVPAAYGAGGSYRYDTTIQAAQTSRRPGVSDTAVFLAPICPASSSEKAGED